MAKAKTTDDTLKLKPINKRLVTVRLIGLSPLITHKWSEKAKAMIRDKQQTGKKTKNRDLRDPEQECKDATYWCDAKCTIPGAPVVAVKAAVIEAAHNDLGFPKTLLRKSLFIYPAGRESIVPLEFAKQGCGQGSKDSKFPAGELTEDVVRVGQGSTDLRYRPYFYDWAITTQWQIDAELLQVQDLLILLDRAGFGVGICEWRPEKGGEYGRFRVDDKFKVIDEAM
ncbi:hypothetical protein [Petrachloros mirabilis]